MLNLSVSKSRSPPNPVRQGELLIYNYTIGNAGPFDLTGVFLTDVFPNFAVTVVSSDGGAYTTGPPPGSTITWGSNSGFNLAPGEAINIRLVLRVNNEAGKAPSNGTILSSRAQVSVASGELTEVAQDIRVCAVGGVACNNLLPRLLRISDVKRSEDNSGTTAFTFAVTLSPATANTVTVNYATANGSAIAGNDYTAKSDTLTFRSGQTSSLVTVNVLGDTTREPNEIFLVNLSSASSGATIFDSQGIGTILNDDGPVLRIFDVRRAEGNAGNTAFTFIVTLSPASANAVTVNYATANGTATAPSDYTAKSGPLTFSPGQTSRLVTVNVLGETAKEQNETFFVNLSSASSGATIFDSQGGGTHSQR